MTKLAETSKKVETAAAKGIKENEFFSPVALNPKILSDRLDEASKQAETVKEIVDKAEDMKLIESEDAKAIYNAAENVQKSAAVGDQDATLEHAKILNNRSLLGEMVTKTAEALLF